MDRRTRLLRTVTKSQQILEMGAGYTPVAPKSDGWRTHTVDHATKDELRLKYSGHAAATNLAMVDINVIEDVDTVWRNGLLHEAVPADLLGRVDLIIASHVLEHFPDLIGFLASASRLVGPEGSLSVALPDRRYCFDCFKPWTTTGELLDAHHQGLTRHSLKTAFNHMAYSASTDGQLGWGARPIDVPILMDPFKTAATVADLVRDLPDRPYDDYHAWQFTPAGFQLAILELAALGRSDWHVASLEPSETFEFFVLLRQGGGEVIDPVSLQQRRRELLVSQLIETREQVDFMLGRDAKTAARPKPYNDSYRDIVSKVAELDRAGQSDGQGRIGPESSGNRINAIWRRFRGNH